MDADELRAARKPILPLSEQEAWCQFNPREASAEIEKLRRLLKEAGDQLGWDAAYTAAKIATALPR